MESKLQDEKRTDIHQIRHLPLISNPIINVLFNNPDLKNNGILRDLTNKLCSSPEDYALLIPDTYFLLNHDDKDSGMSYRHLSYDIDFIQSHIIRINSFKEPQISTHKTYSTLNNKLLSIKKNCVMNVRGYKHDFKVKIKNQELWRGFAKYIPIGTCFHVVYISEAMVGNPKLKIPRCSTSRPFIPHVSVVENDELVELKPERFENIVGEFPELLNVAEKYRALFLDFNVKNCKNEEGLEKKFLEVIAQGSNIFNSLPNRSCVELLKKYTDDQLKESIYNYLEMNIYDKFWAKYLKICDNKYDRKLSENYSSLQWLSITQVGLSDEILYDSRLLMKLQKSVLSAITEFRRLQFANTSNDKCLILCSTFRTLSNNSTIDADTLISLFILVIAQSGISDLNSHLSYIKKYSYLGDSSIMGFQGYTLSSFEVVLKYYSGRQNFDQLLAHSVANNHLWTLIKSVSSDSIQNSNKSKDKEIMQEICALLDPYRYSDSLIPSESFTKSRTTMGESCLMLGIQQHNYQLIKLLLSYEYIFTLDDLLEDTNLEGTNLLALALQLEHPIARTLANIILQATPEELVIYTNQADSKSRTLGHFLFNDHSFISKFGKYIDWKHKDISGHTPFMAIIRCYDHPEYVKLMELTMCAVKNWYTLHGIGFNHRDHIDFKGNTLMHSIKDSLILKLFLDTFEDLELNTINDANLSAISLAVRYNRLENVKIFINDTRTDLGTVDNQLFLNVVDYVKLDRWIEKVNREISIVLENSFIKNVYGDMQVACIRARFQSDKGLCLYFRVQDKDKTAVIPLSLSSFLKVLKLIKNENACLPVDPESSLWIPNYVQVSMRGNIYSSNKLKINCLVSNINIMLQCLLENGTLDSNEIFHKTFKIPENDTTQVLRVKEINEVEELKFIASTVIAHRHEELTDIKRFRSMIQTPEQISAYKTFLLYTVDELGHYEKQYAKLYNIQSFAQHQLNDLGYLQTNIPTFPPINDKTLRLIPADDAYLDRVRFCFATVTELISASKQLMNIKLKRWWKLYGDLRIIKTELEKLSQGKRRGKLQNVLSQIEVLVSESEEEKYIETLRKSVCSVILKKSGVSSLNNESIAEEAESGLGWLIEQRRVAYANRLIDSFENFKIEIVELNIEIMKSYESLCVSVSKFYQFRVKFSKLMFSELSKGKIGELKRQLSSMNLGLQESKMS